MKDQSVRITDQCISLEKQMVQLRDAIAHGDWEKAQNILANISLISEDPEWMDDEENPNRKYV